MRTNKALRCFAVLISCVLCLPMPVTAQEITGTPGSPSATISGKQLPPPDPKFGGVIREKASESEAWWPPRVVPPKGAPNVLLIMTDDSGYGAPSTFGGVVPTPALGGGRKPRIAGVPADRRPRVVGRRHCRPR